MTKKVSTMLYLSIRFQAWEGRIQNAMEADVGLTTSKDAPSSKKVPGKRK